MSETPGEGGQRTAETTEKRYTETITQRCIHSRYDTAIRWQEHNRNLNISELLRK
jgi:hypothetical protein